MTHNARANVPSFRERALTALSAEAPEGETRSCFAQNERYCLFANAAGGDRGIEFLFEFPDDAGSRSSLDTPFELRADGRAILGGTWRTELTIGGRPLAAEGKWETVCAETAKAYAFCERTIAVGGGRLFSRRIFLAYNEALLVVADELLPTPGERQAPQVRACRSLIPLEFETIAKTEEETREILLATLERPEKRPQPERKSRNAPRSEEEALLAEIDASEPEPKSRESVLARVFPLGLPEWRVDSSRGEFNALESSNALELETTSSGAALFAPLVFDFNVRRAARPCSWRPLTVGEKLRPAREDDAFGRRLQLGTEQYALYASTSERPAIRSILSRNLLSDFMFGKFLAARGVVPIVDVEVDES